MRWRILSFALPASLEVVLYHLFGLVDQLFVASLGEASFVAAGLTAQLLSLAFVLLTALGSGASIRLSRYAGAQDENAFSAAAAQLLVLSGLVSLAATAGMVLGTEPAFRLMGAAPEVVERGTLFARLVAGSMPFMALTEMGSQVLRARGDARSPLLIGLLSLVLNSALNYLLINGWGPVPRLGLEGAGLATLLARGVGFALVCRLLLSPRHALRIHPRHLALPDGGQTRALLRLALPLVAGQGVWMLGMMGYTRVYAELGTPELAAASMVNQLEAIWVLLSFGFGLACLNLVGQELGRRRPEEAHRVAAECLRLALALSVVTGGMMAATTLVLGRLYPRLEEGTLALAAAGLLAGALAQPLKVRNMIMSMGVLRGGGDVRFVTACEILILPGIAGAWLLSVPTGWGFLGVVVGKVCEELLKLATFSWRYSSRRWLHEVA